MFDVRRNVTCIGSICDVCFGYLTSLGLFPMFVVKYVTCS